MASGRHRNAFPEPLAVQPICTGNPRPEMSNLTSFDAFVNSNPFPEVSMTMGVQAQQPLLWVFLNGVTVVLLFAFYSRAARTLTTSRSCLTGLRDALLEVLA